MKLAIQENSDDQIRIAPMLLIVFVENAFKYSKATRKKDMLVAFSLEAKENWITFTIKIFCIDGAENTGIDRLFDAKRIKSY